MQISSMMMLLSIVNLSIAAQAVPHWASDIFSILLNANQQVLDEVYDSDNQDKYVPYSQFVSQPAAPDDLLMKKIFDSLII